MAKKSFIMVSLEEDKAKALAQVISNDKCRKIIDYLTENDKVTETKIAEELNLPLSTVHYNIQQLVKNNLVESEEYHYSKKGKEVQHYSLANKYIIISPKPVYGIKQKLKDILPVALFIGATAAAIKFGSRFFGSTETAYMQKAMDSAVPEMLRTVNEAVEEAAPIMADDTFGGAAQQVIETSASNINTYLLWFLGGAALAIVIYILIDWLKKRKGSQK